MIIVHTHTKIAWLKTHFKSLTSDLAEFVKFFLWYLAKKVHFVGVSFEETKGIIVDILMVRRGAYQKTFFRVGLLLLALFALFFTPIVVSQYPRAVQSSALSEQSPSTVTQIDTGLGTTEVQTQESPKPRRDVIEHEVAAGETLSTIAQKYDVNVASIRYPNKFDSDSKVIKPGDKLKIPPVTGVIVTVQSGDNIYTLAKKYSLPSAQSIVDWPYNVFVDDEKFSLAIGQTLVIPGGVPPQEAPRVAVLRQTPVNNGPFTPGNGLFAWPTAGSITQYLSSYHTGVDIASNSRPHIYAADSGRVVSVLYETYGYGYHVIIDHGNGYQSLYGHMSRIDVSVGQNVSRGENLGFMGSTGRSTGPHLHFEIRQDGRILNPLGFLK